MTLGSTNGSSEPRRNTRRTQNDDPPSDTQSRRGARPLGHGGCIQCQMGSKLVLFITGNCHWQCDYCPLSETRRDIDWMFANERRCETFDEVIEEARAMRATGAGITGGDPLMARERTLEGISRLKSEFGPGFHLHMYTSIPFNPNSLASSQMPVSMRFASTS